MRGAKASLAGLALAGLLLDACTAGSQAPAPRHVFVIVMENKSPQESLAGPFTASLAARYREAANYRAVSHPSVPNYLALTSGQTWGVADDGYHVLPKSDLGDQLTTAGVSWRAYMEGLGSQGCLHSPLPYDPGHNPFVFYGGRCPASVVPLSALEGDLAGGGPRFAWITPDRCHDTHDCPVSAGDEWLRRTVALITHSKAWGPGAILFITWDEDDGSAGNQVLTLVVGPGLSHRVSHQSYTHYALLATIEDLLGVGRLGQAAGARPMRDLISP